MKLRKLEFKTVAMMDETYDEKKKVFVEVDQGTFSYREIVRTILLSPGPSGANSSEEVVKSVLIYGRLKDEIRKGKDYILLDREEYDYFLSRLNNFKWALAHPAVADFIKYVRDLKEVEVVEDEKATTPASDGKASA